MTTTFDPGIGPATKELGSTPPAPPPDVLDDTAPELVDEPEPPMVDEGLVRAVLQGLGNTASLIDRHRSHPHLWKFTADELDQLCPPLTRLANRNPTLRRALIHGDFVVIAMALGQYSARNISDRREAIELDRQQRQRLSSTGPPGSGGDPRFGNGSHPPAPDAGRRPPDAPYGAEPAAN